MHVHLYNWSVLHVEEFKTWQPSREFKERCLTLENSPPLNIKFLTLKSLCTCSMTLLTLQGQCTSCEFYLCQEHPSKWNACSRKILQPGNPHFWNIPVFQNLWHPQWDKVHCSVTLGFLTTSARAWRVHQRGINLSVLHFGVKPLWHAMISVTYKVCTLCV